VDATPPDIFAPVARPEGSDVVVSGFVVDAHAPVALSVTNARTGDRADPAVGADRRFEATMPGRDGDRLTLRATDEAGNASAPVDVVAKPTGLPSDAAGVATPIDPTIATDFADATRFLYAGPDPIQQGVQPGAIEPRRVAVLRGRVADRAGAAIAAVRVTVLGHPELGSTQTRTDGVYDIALNGGGPVTLNLAKEGLIPAQRQVPAPYRDFVAVDTVVMIPFDAAVTRVDLAASGVKVARGSPASDADGARRATLMFPPGMEATMTLPDGSSRALGTIGVRATEFTVGDGGPQAMPGQLPSTSGYTYAAELSVDEAVAAGATQVRFDRPVPFYLENFLGMPVGQAVPFGTYDRLRGVWVPEDNGRVIKIVSISDGKAAVDTDGDGAADGGLSIPDDELRALGATYAAGQSLWRTPVAHFTPVDLNWPWTLPPDARPPDVPDPDTEAPTTNDPCAQSGSIIECENQVLRERVPLTGTPFALAYSSDRAPGATAKRTMRIPVSGAGVPGSLEGIRLAVAVAGRAFYQSFSPQSDLAVTFTWDGRDAYGRVLIGAQPVSVRIDYDYPPVRVDPADADRAFARFGSFPSPNQGRSGLSLYKDWQGTLRGEDGRGLEAAGWSLDVHHSYDPTGRVLYRGDGGRRHVGALGAVIDTVATFTNGGYEGMAAGPDGSVYVSTECVVNRVTPGGEVVRFAGLPSGQEGACQTSGDGGAATDAGIYPGKLALGPDGSLYIGNGISDPSGGIVRRVTPDGVIRTVAGNHGWDDSGDGGPATEAALYPPKAIAVTPDGVLYIAYRLRHYGVLRRVSTDGYISTAGHMTAASLAAGPDGSLYYGDDFYGSVARLSPDGKAAPFAGTGGISHSGDGGPATQAAIGIVTGLAVSPDGSVFISTTGTSSTNRIRRVDSDGIITTLAGTGKLESSGDGGPAAAASLDGPMGVAWSPDGTVNVWEISGGLRRVSELSPTTAFFDLVVPSEDGREVYVFDSRGRHLRTLHALTGGLLFEFGYDDARRLVRVVDGDGNATQIQRDDDGRATAVVAPGGQRTALGVNGAGRLASVSGPGGVTHRMTYDDGGLLTGFTDPLGRTSTLTYDALGLLTRDQDAAGASKSLSAVASADSRSVTVTAASGRTRVYTLTRLPAGGFRRETTGPGGERAAIDVAADGSETRTSPDGMRVTTAFGPDPRWGMLAPIPVRIIREWPGGRRAVTTAARSVDLADDDDPFSLVSLTETVNVDGRSYGRVYEADIRELRLTSAEGRVTVAGFDIQGRVVHLQPDGLDALTAAYDGRGRLIRASQGDRSVNLTYDAGNRVVSRTDAAGALFEFAHDDTGRLIELLSPGGQRYRFGYDAAGNRTSVVMPNGATHRLEYTATGEEASYAPPGNPSYATTYDLDRMVDLLTLPGGRSVEVSYDSGGRVAGAGSPEASVLLGYEDATDRVSRLMRSPSGGGSAQGLGLSYDGDVLTTISFTGRAEGRFEFAYDLDRSPSSVRLASGAESFDTSLVRDDDGLLTQEGPYALTRGGPGGAVSRIADGVLDETTGYDGQGRVVRRAVSVNGNALYRIELAYDAAGRVSRKAESAGGADHTLEYAYDADGQLLEARRDGSVAERYTYDANGNRTSSQAGDAPAEEASYDAQDRITAASGDRYEIDADGFLARRAADTFRYGTQGELLEATVAGVTVRYDYDGLGRRVARTDADGTTQYLYGNPDDEFQVSAVRDPRGKLVRLTYDPSGRLYALERDGARFYVATDQVGTPRLIADASGRAVDVLEADAFGLPASGGLFGLPIGFAGGIADPTTGLVRFGNRDYDPATGRWTARDPVRFAGGQANLYAYVGGDPVGRRDPTGLADGQCPLLTSEQTPVDPSESFPNLLEQALADEARENDRLASEELKEQLKEARQRLKKKLEDVPFPLPPSPCESPQCGIISGTRRG
jgi:RHS repeat-associated protein